MQDPGRRPGPLAVSPAGTGDAGPWPGTSSVPHDPAHGNMAARWPALAQRRVVVGGAEASFAEAAAAAALLAASRTSAIAPVLRAAGSPLAGCDYLAVAAPYLALARAVPKTGRCGAAGRHVTKHAFLLAVAGVLDAAREAELASWRRALSTDERYAVAIARDAVGVRQRAHAAGIRSSVRSAVIRAVASCELAAGQFTCAESSACGTGGCRFAAGACRGVAVPAGPGRIARPANHIQAGKGFTEAGAADALAAGVPWRAGVPVADCAPAA